jgi:hypothetical protein
MMNRARSLEKRSRNLKTEIASPQKLTKKDIKPAAEHMRERRPGCAEQLVAHSTVQLVPDIANEEHLTNRVEKPDVLEKRACLVDTQVVADVGKTIAAKEPAPKI